MLLLKSLAHLWDGDEARWQLQFVEEPIASITGEPAKPRNSRFGLRLPLRSEKRGIFIHVQGAQTAD
jgi:hypothetical protein